MKSVIFSLSMTIMISLTVDVFAQDVNRPLFNQYANNGMSAQSADCYGDYMVCVTAYVSKIGLYNLKSKKMLYICKLRPWTELRGKTDIYHANNSSFGLQKFKDSDPFPLLYVSHRENNDLRGVLQVYRIIPLKSSSEKEDYDSLKISLVQTIYYPQMTDDNALGSTWTVIDKRNNCMYTYSRNNRGKSKNNGICRITKFNIPSVRESNEVYLNDNDILDSYEVDFQVPYSQGACIHNDILYIPQGMSPKDFLWLRIIDLKKKKLVETINLKDAGFPTEPEGCFIYNNHLMFSTASKGIFTINIPIE